MTVGILHLLVTEPPRLKILHQAQEELSVGIKNQNYSQTKTDKDLRLNYATPSPTTQKLLLQMLLLPLYLQSIL